MRVLFACLTGFMVAVVYGALEPILSLRLADYNLGSTYTGLVFGVEAIFYMISTFMVPYVVPEWVESRVTLITSTFMMSFATVLVGPFYTEQSLVAMIIGLAFSGFFISFMMIPNISEMMQAVKVAYPSLASSDHTNSMLSGMFNGFYGFGQALGPLLGSYLYEATGENFRLTMNIVGGICLVFSLLYFCFANGCQAFS